jgi:hypothetical protein
MTTMLIDVATRTHPAFMAPVGSLLALAAWYQGARDVASRIIATVLELSPSYSMAHLVHTALYVDVPADELGRRLPTPAELDRAMGAPRPEWLWPLQQSLTRYLNTEERPSV